VCGGDMNSALKRAMHKSTGSKGFSDKIAPFVSYVP
jgi:hypothetical protein